jgi:peptidoglycan/LPS O-acetylase OafA/YrhL
MSYASRVPCLDGLRGIAAIGVMLFHFNIFFLPQARLPFVGRAYVGVDLFFLLSGFVMAHVYGRLLASNWRAHWSEFARARWARIYPLFAMTTLAMVIAVALFKASLTYVSFTVGSLWLQPFLLQQWASGLSWDYPSWSIGTEAEAYIFFVFAAGPLLTGKHPRLIAACCVTILAAVSIAGGGSLNLFNGVSALMRTLSEFSLGVLLYRAHLDATVFPRKWAAMLFVLFVGLWATSRLDFFVVVAFGCLLYHAAGTKDTYGRLLNSRPLVALGNWSYSVYLWHAPTHYAVMASFAAIGLPVNHLGLLSSRLLLLVTGLAVVGLSAFNYQFFEIPVRRLVLYSRPVGFIRWQRR